jgi:hypothetical protein
MPLLKVTDCERTKRFCVVADTVEELTKKCQYKHTLFRCSLGWVLWKKMCVILFNIKFEVYTHSHKKEGYRLN